eukprot:NODE_12127_length_1244_cov_6.281110.p1 GENE.NODE_12127_length_1244_cov_6.281110~~NODE_12127_length_1244_cov_6.281110.p1  ORF type:complete len:310 (-),score=100.86 NODE_12127_length_1244_cov_6.281110:8-937(-)
MLRDAPCCEAYRKAIEYHAAAWTERSNVEVIDVHSGAGLLAVLCARAGARRVVAVEKSRLAHYLRATVARNTDAGAVEVHECLAEELQLEEGRAVDCIVSMWMGHALLFGNALSSVLAVRDRYLIAGGVMLPSMCRLCLVPFEDSAWRQTGQGFWDDVQGVDMSALAPVAAVTHCVKPQHRRVPEEALFGAGIGAEVILLDMLTVKEADLDRFEAAMRFEVPAGRRLDGFVAWFECEFGAAGWLLSTHPSSAPTRWQQTAFHFRKPLDGGGGVTVDGTAVFERGEGGYRATFDLRAGGRKGRVEAFEPC